MLVRLEGAGGRKGTIPIRADAHWLACTDKICVPEEGELSLDLAGRQRNAGPGAVRRLAPTTAAAARERRSFRGRRTDKLRVAIPLPASVKVDEPYLFSDRRTGAVDYDAQQDFRRVGRYVDRRASAQRRAPPQFPAVIALATDGGSNFARSRVRCRKRTPIGGARLERRDLGGARRNRRRNSPQPDALRLPDPCAQGPAYLASGRSGGARPGGRARLCRRGDRRHRSARRRLCLQSAPPAPRRAGRSSCRIRARSCSCSCSPLRSLRTCSACSSCRCSAALRSPREVSGPERSRLRCDALRRAVPGRGARHGTRCCRQQARYLVFAALGLGLASRSSLSLSSRRFAPGCPSQVRGCDACSNSSQFRWPRAQPRLSGCSIARLPTRALLFGAFCGSCARLCLYFVGRMQRAGRSQAWIAALLSLVVVIAAVARIPAAPTAAHRVALRSRAVERGSCRELCRGKASRCSSISLPTGALPARSTKRRRSTATKCATRSARQALRCSRATGPTAIQQSRASSKARAGPAYPSICGTRPASRPKQLPQVLTPAMLISRAQALPKR